MGMYTALRFKVKVKNKYLDPLKKILNQYCWEEIDGIPATKEWLEFGRCNFIPFGDPDNTDPWCEDRKRFGASVLDENGWWSVITSLKNYTNEIEFFLSRILSELAEESEYIEDCFETETEPTSYDFSTLKDLSYL